MAHSSTSRRFYIDLDTTDDHAIVRRIPVHKADWVAPEPDQASTIAPSSPATHAVVRSARITPHRVTDLLRAVRKRQHHPSH